MSQAGSSGSGNGGGGIITINGDSGSATGSTINLLGANAGASIKFDASGSTINFNVTDADSNTIFGSNNYIPGGFQHSFNSIFGNSILTLGGTGAISNGNSLFGRNILPLSTVSAANSVFGWNILTSAVSGSGNSVLGNGVFSNLLSGGNNNSIGTGNGSAYTSNESYNNLIGNALAGVVGDNYVTRIADNTSPNPAQKCFVGGVAGVTTSNSQSVTIDSVTGQLGSTASIISPATSCAFSAYLTGNIANATGDGTDYTIPWDGIIFNSGSVFAAGTGVFTAPTNGIYNFNYTMGLYNIDVTQTLCVGTLVTNGLRYYSNYMNPFTGGASNGIYMATASWTIVLSAGDTVQTNAEVNFGSKTAGIYGGIVNSTFSGFRVVQT